MSDRTATRLTDDDLRLVDPVSVRRALALFREFSWARALLGVVALSVVFVFLGRWQYHRHEGKVERRDLVAANYGGAPVPLTDVLPSPTVALPATKQWTQVRVRGSYDPSRTLLVRNRPYQGEYGFEVLVPLRLPDGGTLVVDRGWVPFGETATTEPDVPAPPAGDVEVVARLRPPEPSDGRTAVAGQVQRIDLGRIGPLVGGDVYRAYGVLAAEKPAPADAPLPLPRPDTDLGPHLAYAYNWWGFAVAAFGLLGYYALREVQTRRLAAVGFTSEQVAAARAERSRRRKVRDEDWEDAADGAA